jgi:hypothetical protein
MSSFARRSNIHKSLNGKELTYISIGWLHDLNAIVSKSQLHSMCKCFLLVGVRYISYGGFQTKVYKIGGCYSVRMTRKEKLVLCENSVNSIPLRS